MSTSLPNLFLLLELDPNDPWDPKLFQQRLLEKRREWSRLTQMPSKRGLQAKQNLNQIPTLERIAADESLRKQQADAARRKRKTASAERLQEFDESLLLLEARGEIYESELQHLIKTYSSILTEADIRKRLRVPVKKDPSKRKPRQQALEPSKARDIARRVQSLGKENLYDFLGMSSNTESGLLYRHAQGLYDGVGRKASKTAQDTIVSELCGYCLDFFKSEQERAKYDETLRRQAFENLKKKLTQVAKVSGRLEAAQMQQLLREARELGLDLAETQDVLLAHAADRGYAVFVADAASGSIANLQRCGYCGQLADQDKKHCTGCGQLLKEPCPKCGQMGSTEQMTCGSCGFPTGNRSWVRHLVGEAERARGQRQLALALEHIEQAKAAWPLDGQDSIARQVVELESKVRPAYIAQEQALEEMRKLIEQRRFFAARDALPHLIRSLPDGSPELASLRQQVEERIQLVENKLASMRRQAGADPEALVLSYQEVVRLCDDCEEARDMLARTPPSSPSAVQAVLGGRVVHLSWQPSRSRGVRYAIVRKSRTRPVSVSDGQHLATVAGTSYDDTQPEAGLPQFYAVFADREGVPSKTAATLAQPIMLLEEVSNLTARVDDQEVHLQWRPPANVHDLIVLRSDQGRPRSVQDGTRIPVIGTDQAVDGQVQNGRRYYYAVFSRFKDYSSRLVTSPGAPIEAVPQRPPRPIDGVRLAATGPAHARQVQLDWEPPEKGDVVIVKADKSTGLKLGEVLSQQELTKYGQILPAARAQARDKIDRLGFYFYLPVVVFQDMAYIGGEVRYVCVDDVSDLRVQNLGGRLRLEWRWPLNCQEVIVTYSHQGWSQPNESHATTIPLVKAQYDLRGHFDISDPSQADYYIVVYAVITQGGQRIISSGLDAGCRKRLSLRNRITVQYEITKTWRGRKRRLKLYVKGEGELPSLVLARKRGSLPMKRTDGTIILRLEPMTIEENNFNLDIPNDALQGRSYVRLFLEDDEMYDFVTIRHPSRDKLRLF